MYTHVFVPKKKHLLYTPTVSFKTMTLFPRSKNVLFVCCIIILKNKYNYKVVIFKFK